jgi:hypothetical protein
MLTGGGSRGHGFFDRLFHRGRRWHRLFDRGDLDLAFSLGGPYVHDCLTSSSVVIAPIIGRSTQNLKRAADGSGSSATNRTTPVEEMR